METLSDYLEKISICPECQSELTVENFSDDNSSVETRCTECDTRWQVKVEFEEI